LRRRTLNTVILAPSLSGEGWGEVFLKREPRRKIATSNQNKSTLAGSENAARFYWI
jgi:hypothetical protein